MTTHPPITKKLSHAPSIAIFTRHPSPSSTKAWLAHLCTGALFFAMRSCEYTKTTSHRRTNTITLNDIKFYRNRRLLSHTDLSSILLILSASPSGIKNETNVMIPSHNIAHWTHSYAQSKHGHTLFAVFSACLVPHPAQLSTRSWTPLLAISSTSPLQASFRFSVIPPSRWERMNLVCQLHPLVLILIDLQPRWPCT